MNGMVGLPVAAADRRGRNERHKKKRYLEKVKNVVLINGNSLVY